MQACLFMNSIPASGSVCCLGGHSVAEFISAEHLATHKPFLIVMLMT